MYGLYVESKNMIRMNLFTQQEETHRHIYGTKGEKEGEG